MQRVVTSSIFVLILKMINNMLDKTNFFWGTFEDSEFSVSSSEKLKFKSFLIALTHPLQLLLGHTHYRENKMLLTLFAGSSTEKQKRREERKGETLQRVLVRLLWI